MEIVGQDVDPRTSIYGENRQAKRQQQHHHHHHHQQNRAYFVKGIASMNLVNVSLLERDCQIEHGRRRLPQGKGRKTIVIQHKKSHKIAKSNCQVVMTECRNHLAASTGSQFSIYYWLFDLLILAHFLAKPSNWFSSYICDSPLAGRGGGGMSIPSPINFWPKYPQEPSWYPISFLF